LPGAPLLIASQATPVAVVLGGHVLERALAVRGLDERALGVEPLEHDALALEVGELDRAAVGGREREVGRGLADRGGLLPGRSSGFAAGVSVGGVALGVAVAFAGVGRGGGRGVLGGLGAAVTGEREHEGQQGGAVHAGLRVAVYH
jgi:hypothetical protein